MNTVSIILGVIALLITILSFMSPIGSVVTMVLFLLMIILLDIIYISISKKFLLFYTCLGKYLKGLSIYKDELNELRTVLRTLTRTNYLIGIAGIFIGLIFIIINLASPSTIGYGAAIAYLPLHTTIMINGLLIIPILMHLTKLLDKDSAPF